MKIFRFSFAVTLTLGILAAGLVTFDPATGSVSVSSAMAKPHDPDCDGC